MRKTIFTLVAIMAVLFMSCGGGGSNSAYDPYANPQVKSIEISPKNVTLHIGEPIVLKAKIYPSGVDHDIYWYEASGNAILFDRSIQTDSLQIWGNYVGESVVGVCENYSQQTGTCNVNVINEPVAVEKITFDNVALDMYEGQYCDVVPTVYPVYATDSLVWSTENTEIATVGKDNFWIERTDSKCINRHSTYVQTLKPGSTNIVASSKDGSVVAKYNLTVKCISDIKLDKSELELYESQQGILNITVLPEGATIKNIVWKSENEDIATIRGDWESIRVIGGRSGETNIVGTSYDGKIVVKCHVTVKNNNTIDYHPYGDDEQW